MVIDYFNKSRVAFTGVLRTVDVYVQASHRSLLPSPLESSLGGIVMTRQRFLISEPGD